MLWPIYHHACFEDIPVYDLGTDYMQDTVLAFLHSLLWILTQMYYISTLIAYSTASCTCSQNTGSNTLIVSHADNSLRNLGKMADFALWMMLVNLLGWEMLYWNIKD